MVLSQGILMGRRKECATSETRPYGSRPVGMMAKRGVPLVTSFPCQRERVKIQKGVIPSSESSSGSIWPVLGRCVAPSEGG